jgi:hypothetical protein
MGVHISRWYLGVPGTCYTRSDERLDEKERIMAKGKEHTSEQIVHLLRKVERQVEGHGANGSTPES